MNEEITTLQGTLTAAPHLSPSLKPQIENRIKRRDQAVRKLNLNLKAETNEEFLAKDQIEQELVEIKEAIGNFIATLDANPVRRH